MDSQKSPWVGSVSFSLNQTASIVLSHLQISVCSKYCIFTAIINYKK